MSISLTVPVAEDLLKIAVDLSSWQIDGKTIELHPGDLGWHSMVGAERTASDLRVWARHGEMAALGLLDKPDLLRIAMNPVMHDDEELIRRVGSDVHDPQVGILAGGEAAIGARGAQSLRQFLSSQGWDADEPWTPFHCDLSRPIDTTRLEQADIRVEQVNYTNAEAWVAVHWSAFKGTHLSEADRQRFLRQWSAMAEGPFSHLARHLIAFDRAEDAVAVITVWSAGVGGHGLIEPMAVHRGYQGRGYGTAATVAGLVALQDMGSSSAVVATESSNAGAVAAYTSAGFTAQEPAVDMKRTAEGNSM